MEISDIKESGGQLSTLSKRSDKCKLQNVQVTQEDTKARPVGLSRLYSDRTSILLFAVSCEVMSSTVYQIRTFQGGTPTHYCRDEIEIAGFFLQGNPGSVFSK